MDPQISVGTFEGNESICIVSKYLPFKGRNGNFMVEKLSRHHLNEVIKVNYHQ